MEYAITRSHLQFKTGVTDQPLESACWCIVLGKRDRVADPDGEADVSRAKRSLMKFLLEPLAQLCATGQNSARLRGAEIRRPSHRIDRQMATEQRRGSVYEWNCVRAKGRDLLNETFKGNIYRYGWRNGRVSAPRELL